MCTRYYIIENLTKNYDPVIDEINQESELFSMIIPFVANFNDLETPRYKLSKDISQEVKLQLQACFQKNINNIKIIKNRWCHLFEQFKHENKFRYTFQKYLLKNDQNILEEFPFPKFKSIHFDISRYRKLSILNYFIVPLPIFQSKKYNNAYQDY